MIYIKKQNIKKIIVLVAGSLVIALVVSILPSGFLVNAADISRREASKIALEYVNDDSAEITVVDDRAIDDDKPFYTVMIKTDKYKYEIVVDAKTGEIESKLNKKEAVKDTKTDTKLNQDKDEVVKTTAEAQLNQELQEDMKDALTDHKEALVDLNKDDEYYKEDKEEIRLDFKDSKDEIKEERKLTKIEIKEDKKEITETDNKDKDDKSVKLVKNVKIEPEEALLIALKSIGFNGTLDRITIDLNADNEYVLTNSQIKELKFDILDVEIVLDSEDNPTTYIIQLEYKSYDNTITNTIKIHATSGKILDYEKEINDKSKVKVTDVNKENIKVENANKDKDSKFKENNGKKKN